MPDHLRDSANVVVMPVRNDDGFDRNLSVYAQSFEVLKCCRTPSAAVSTRIDYDPVRFTEMDEDAFADARAENGDL
jgi:hypothetical protein